MVHELSGLAGSQFINNRSTFISTAFNEGDYELRKYLLRYLDHVFRICQVIGKKICRIKSILLWFSNR